MLDLKNGVFAQIAAIFVQKEDHKLSRKTPFLPKIDVNRKK
jgi:hypothetical protein